MLFRIAGPVDVVITPSASSTCHLRMEFLAELTLWPLTSMTLPFILTSTLQEPGLELFDSGHYFPLPYQT